MPMTADKRHIGVHFGFAFYAQEGGSAVTMGNKKNKKNKAIMNKKEESHSFWCSDLALIK